MPDTAPSSDGERKAGAAAEARPPVDRLSREQLLELHHFLRLNRALEERLSLLYRQKRLVSNVYRSLGQEACSVGSAYALGRGDLFAPMTRNLGAVLVRGARPADLFAQYLGRDGPSHGRDSGAHFGWISDSGSMLPPVAMLGDMIAILVGAVLAERLRGRASCALNWIGDGGASTGAFHEGFNLACVLRAPLVLIVENNRFAFSTPTERQTANPRFVDRARAYGSFGERVDGTDVLAVYEATRQALARGRAGQGPTLIEAEMLRRASHAEQDAERYVPAEVRQEWERKDPVERYERHLVREGLATEEDLWLATRRAEQLADDGLREAEALPFPRPESALEGVWADRAAVSPTPPIVLAHTRKGARPWRT
jgi:TPP-dependent pyruvate/acetoin dehydrogenase alpha subunit